MTRRGGDTQARVLPGRGGCSLASPHLLRGGPGSLYQGAEGKWSTGAGSWVGGGGEGRISGPYIRVQ